VEAARSSGALITAGFAADYGREVMAVPGRVTSPTSRGAHALLKDGAAPVESWADVVAALPRPFRKCVGPAPLRASRTGAPDPPGGEAGRLLGLIGEDALGMDDVIARSGLAAGRVATLLSTLEIDGWVRQLPGKRFIRAGRA
jgi:DNA processing protein